MNGLIIQWGTMSVSGTTSKDFYIDFSNTDYIMNGNIVSSHDDVVRFVRTSVSKFSCYAGGNGRTVTWFAIGY